MSNKNTLVPGTIKGIQIVDLEKKIYNKSSSKQYSIRFNKQKNYNNFNNSINNDSSLFSPKDNLTNKNIAIISKIKQQPHITISSNQNNGKNIKIKGNIIVKTNKRNILKIKSNPKNNKINNFPKPAKPKQKEILIYRDKQVAKKLLSYSQSRRPSMQGTISKNNNNNSNHVKKEKNSIKKMKSEPNSKKCFLLSENNENYLNKEYRNFYDNEQKRKIRLVFKKILTMNTDIEQISFIKSSITTTNYDINTSFNNIEKKDKNFKKSKTINKTYIISKDKIDRDKSDKIQKKNIVQAKKIIKKNINNINNSKNYNSNNSNVSSNKNNNSLYLKENINIRKLNNSNSLGAFNESYKNHNIRNLSNIKNNNSILNATLVNQTNKMNSTFNNNIFRLNSSSKSKNKSCMNENKILIKNKRYINSKNNKQKNKLNNFVNNTNKLFNKKDSENYNKSPTKNKQINIIMIHSNAKNNINPNIIITASNNNKNKEKEIIKENPKENIVSSAICSKNEMIKKIKINNYKNISSQKKRKLSHYNNGNNKNNHISNDNIRGNGNNHKYKIINKIKNNQNMNNSNYKVNNIKGKVKLKGYNILNETSNIQVNSLIKESSGHDYLEKIKSSISPKNKETKMLLSNSSCEELPFNKIISIQKIKINSNNSNNKNKKLDIINNENIDVNIKNQKIKKIDESFNYNKNSTSNVNKSFNIGNNINFNNSTSMISNNSNEPFIKTLSLYDKTKKVKKIISISCQMKTQKDKKTKIKVHRRLQSMVNNHESTSCQTKKNSYQNINISLKIKNKPQAINIDLQNDSYVKNKNKIKNSAKKFFNKEEPIPAKKIIKMYKNFLKNNEIEELKLIDKKGELVYYLGEIQDRINNNEKTFSKINHSFIFENKCNSKNDNGNNDNRILNLNKKQFDEEKIYINKSCNNFREGKDENVEKLKQKFEQKNFNDEEGDYKLIVGNHFNYRYEIIECLGKGSFGEAIKCFDHKNNDLVCIKIINSQEKFQSQALTEIKILTAISTYDINNDSNNVKFYSYFNFRGHICLVFELLGKNLYEYLQLNNFIGLDILQIKNYTIQILFSLLFLRSINIIHCDLKPENVLIYTNNPNQIKVIDFGSSCFESERIYLYIQSRFYRAPEVLFDLGYNYEIDMWSLGCILYELYTGVPLFSGINEMEQIYLIMETIGIPPLYIIENSPKGRIFFDDDFKPFFRQNEDGSIFKPGSKKIKDLLKDAPENFIDFINKCLLWNPFDRLTPDRALLHPFIIENMNGLELYKHKLKIKHIKYGMQNYNIYNINSTRNKDSFNYCQYNKEIINHRGNSCGSNRNLNKNQFKFNNNEITYTNTVCGENEDIKKNNESNYFISHGNKRYNNFGRKKRNKKLPLSIDVDVNLRRINTTENYENNYRKISKYKKNKKKLPKHLPKKKSLGRIKNNNKIIKNAYK